MKYRNIAIKYATPAAFLTAVGTGSAFAAGPDFSTLVAAVDFSTAVTGIMSVAAALALAYVALRGAKIVLSSIR